VSNIASPIKGRTQIESICDWCTVERMQTGERRIEMELEKIAK